MQITSSIIVLASYKLPKCDAESIFTCRIFTLYRYAGTRNAVAVDEGAILKCLPLHLS